VPAPDLEHPVIRTDVQLLDDRSQPLAHDPASRLARPTLVMVDSYPTPVYPRASVKVSPP
jgi:hypothetical protein